MGRSALVMFLQWCLISPKDIFAFCPLLSPLLSPILLSFHLYVCISVYSICIQNASLLHFIYSGFTRLFLFTSGFVLSSQEEAPIAAASSASAFPKTLPLLWIYLSKEYEEPVQLIAALR